MAVSRQARSVGIDIPSFLCALVSCHFAALTLTSELQGQTMVVITGSPSSSRREVEARVVARFDTERYPIFEVSPSVTQLRSGEFLIIGHEKTSVGVFSKVGKHVRTFGRQGGGPGEFRMIHAVMRGPGDSVFIYDARAARVTVLDPDARIAARTATAPRFFSGLHFAGKFVAAASLTDEGRVGYPVHVFDGEGRWQRAIGVAVTNFDGSDRSQLMRVFAESVDGKTLAIADANAYEFTLSDQSFRLTSRYVRRLPWFERGRGNMWEGRVLRPRAAVAGASFDAAGMLWIALARPSPGYKAGTPTQASPAESPSERTPTVPEYGRAFVTVIEGIDLAQKTVFAVTTFPGLTGRVSGTDRWWRYSTPTTEEGTLEVFEIIRKR